MHSQNIHVYTFLLSQVDHAKSVICRSETSAQHIRSLDTRAFIGISSISAIKGIMISLNIAPAASPIGQTALTGRVVLLNVWFTVSNRYLILQGFGSPRRIRTSSTVTKLMATIHQRQAGTMLDASTYHPCDRIDRCEVCQSTNFALHSPRLTFDL